jgi:hypothetical protein
MNWLKRYFNSNTGYYAKQNTHSYSIYHGYIFLGIHGTIKVTTCTYEQLENWLKYLNVTDIKIIS